MKITKSQLKQIIKEELENALNEKYLVGQWPFDSQSLDRGRGELEPSPGEDKAAAMRLARSTDTHLDPSIDVDRDRIDRERSFGPDDPELIEFAKELALRAGAEDRTTYDWREFMDEAKKDLMFLGVSR